MKEKIIISPYYGGLGDHLSYSTLPEEFFKQKGTKVYISNYANYRNNEIYELLWKYNPYVIGRIKKKNTFDDARLFKKYNIIQNIERIHKLKINNKYPKIYYRPKNKNLKKIFVVDISSVTLSYSSEELEIIYKEINRLRKKFKDFKFASVKFNKIIVKKKKISFLKKLKFFIKNKKIYGKIEPDSRGMYSYLNKHFYYPMKLDQEIKVNSIFEYCDLISSCSGFVSLHSGQSHLSSAIKYQFNKSLKSFCIIQKKWYLHHLNKGRFIFDNINYIII